MGRLSGAVVVVGVGAAVAGWMGRGHSVEAADRTTTAMQQNAVAPSTIQVFSRETVVDVVVTDKDGQPVRGLTQADFTVKENGNEQAINSFAEFGAEAAKAGVTLSQPAAVQTEVHSNYQQAPARGPVNIVLIDALNASLAGMVIHEQRETAKYLETMPEGTEVAVFGLSQSGLHLLQGFTTDRKLLVGAVAGPCRVTERWRAGRGSG